MILHLDFETRSEVDLPECGANVYADHPSTKILCAAYAVGGDLVQVIEYGSPALTREPTTTFGQGFRDLLLDPDVLIVARNAEFERNILRGVLRLDLPPSRFRCTAAQSARAGLPRSLDGCTALLGLSETKDANGKRLIAKLCKPRRPSKANPDLFWEPETAPEDFAALYEYCAQDVRADRAAWKALPKLTDSEQAIWELTVKMNDRGVGVDLASIPLAKAAAAAETERLAARFYELTGVEHGSVVAAAEALAVPNLTKATVRRALKGDLDPHVREALEIRQKIAKSSLAKLEAFERRTSADGRIRGNLVYSGAERTARWSGYGVQPQNFPRGLGVDKEGVDQQALAFQRLWDGELEGDVLGTLSGMLRGFFISKGAPCS